MPQKTKIAILGTGAVGGYFGGLLAEKYFNSPGIEIIFITRPATEKIIRQRGLKIITPAGEKTVFPNLVSSDPKKIGQIDYLLCCVKSYDLEESLLRLSECISDQTVILPLLNGVDAKERISVLFPKAETWDGCVYIVSRLIEPGVVKETGNIRSFYFGSAAASPVKLRDFEKILKDAGIDAFISGNIEQTIWEKFLFISTIASLTSILDLPIGDILSNRAHREILNSLFKEISLVAKANHILLPENIIERSIEKMEKLPYETTSSMHSDFRKGGKTEYRSLTEYVVNKGQQLNVATPVYSKIREALKQKSK